MKCRKKLARPAKVTMPIKTISYPRRFSGVPAKDRFRLRATAVGLGAFDWQQVSPVDGLMPFGLDSVRETRQFADSKTNHRFRLRANSAR